MWAGVIFSLSSLPGSDVPGRYGTLAHFMEYAVLAALLRIGLRGTSTRGDEVLLAIAIAAAYGVTDELHQAFVTLRVPDVIDWLVDTAGALFGALVADQWLHTLVPRRDQ